MIAERWVFVWLVLAASAAAQEVGRKAEIEFRQRQVLRQMEQLEDRMFQLSEDVRDTEPDHAARLVLGLQRSREDLLVEDMAEIAALILADQLDEAEERQRRVLFQLDELREMLLSTDLDLLLKLERLRKLNRALARMATILSQAEIALTDPGSGPGSGESMRAASLVLREAARGAEILRPELATIVAGNAGVLEAMDQGLEELAKGGAAFEDGLVVDGQSSTRTALQALEVVRTGCRLERKRLLRDLQAFIRRHLSETLLQMQDRQQRVTVGLEAATQRAASGQSTTARQWTELRDHEVEFATRARNAAQLIEETEYSITLPLLLSMLREFSDGLADQLARGTVEGSALDESRRLETHCQEALQILIEEARWAKNADLQDDAQFQYIKLITELRSLRIVQVRTRDDTARMATLDVADAGRAADMARLARFQAEARRVMEALEARGDSELLKRLIAEQDEDL